MGERIGAAAWGAFVVALEGGAKVLEAAAAAGVVPSSLYRRRKRDPAFAATWDEAVAKSAGVVLIAGGNGRILQKRRTRRVRFTRARKELYLGHFAGTCDSKAAAAAAGVCRSTVDKHLRSDPIFAEAQQEALEVGYRALEAELVAQQRAEVERYRVAGGAAPADGADRAAAFERSLKLLAQWRRKDGATGRRDSPRGDARMRWDFADAAALLEKRLKAFGVVLARDDGPVLEGSCSDRGGQAEVGIPLHHPVAGEDP